METAEEKKMNSDKFSIENGIMSGEKKVFNVGKADLGKWFLETLRRKPDFVGQVDAITGEELTYRQMADESVRCALWMRRKGMKPRDVVYICTNNKMSNYIPILATFYNRATIFFGFKGIDTQKVKYLFNLLKPKFIFSESEEVEIYSKAAKETNLDTNIVVFSKVPGFDSLDEVLSQIEPEEVGNFRCSEPTDPEDNCVLPATSGTTGDPKIMMHSYKSIMEALLICTSEEKQDGVVSMIYLPIKWLCALRVVLTGILNFSKRIIVSEMSYDLDEVFQLIEKYKVTHVRFSLGMIYRMIKWKDLEKYDTSSLRAITFNGVKFQPELLKFLMKVVKNGELKQTYGATEMSIPMFGGVMNDIDLDSCGYLFPNMSMKIIDVQTGEILGPKKEGEVCFKSPYLMKSYFNNQKATDEVIDSEGWYHTGDLGYYEESGLGYVIGRLKNTLIMQNGKIVPLWQAERALHLNSEVTQVAMIPVTKSPEESQIFAFVTLIPGSKITEDELSEISNNLSDCTIPVRVKILDRIPLTSNGKVQLNELKKSAEYAIENNMRFPENPNFTVYNL